MGIVFNGSEKDFQISSRNYNRRGRSFIDEKGKGNRAKKTTTGPIN
ncbi:hypothetical protein KSS87_004153, partial [Heliosperma pusillum]